MRVSTRSWHGRAYKRWADSGLTRWQWRWENPDRNRENLCHYVRVILLRVPLRWFFTRTYRGRDWLRPWTVLLAVTSLLGGTVGTVTQPDAAWRVFLALLAGAAAAGLWLAAMVWGGNAVDRVRDRRRVTRGQPRRTDPTFRQVAWSFVKAKKKRICPFIDVVEEP